MPSVSARSRPRSVEKVLRELLAAARKTKHPIFFSRVLSALAELEHELAQRTD